VLDAAVVAEVDDFRTLGLDQAPHDVDRRVVAVEQAGGGDEAQRGGRLRGGDDGGTGRSGHGWGTEKHVTRDSSWLQWKPAFQLQPPAVAAPGPCGPAQPGRQKRNSPPNSSVSARSAS